MGSASIRHAKTTEANRKSITDLNAIDVLKIIEDKKREVSRIWFCGLMDYSLRNKVELWNCCKNISQTFINNSKLDQGHGRLNE